MTYLITQIVLCLLLAALIGFVIGWALRSMACQKKIAELEAAWADRLAAASAGGAPVKRDDLKRIEAVLEAAKTARSSDDPKLRKALEDAGVAHLAWRDRIIRPAVEATENFNARVVGAGKTAGNTGVGLERLGARSEAMRMSA